MDFWRSGTASVTFNTGSAWGGMWFCKQNLHPPGLQFQNSFCSFTEGYSSFLAFWQLGWRWVWFPLIRCHNCSVWCHNCKSALQQHDHPGPKPHHCFTLFRIIRPITCALQPPSNSSCLRTFIPRKSGKKRDIPLWTWSAKPGHISCLSQAKSLCRK